MTTVPVLPNTSTPYERTLAAAMSDALPVPVKQVLTPSDTPQAFIPFLAVHNGARLWFDDWSEPRKRQMIAEANDLADLIGTRPGLRRFLGYVDASVVSAVAHPRRFVCGQSAVGVQPLQFPTFTARYLIKVVLRRHRRSSVLGRSAAGVGATVAVSLEPIRRANIAATISKNPATQYTATFAHRRRPSFDEMQFDMGFDEFIDRTSL